MSREIEFRVWSKKYNTYFELSDIHYKDGKIDGIFAISGTLAGIPNTIFLEPEDVVLEQDTGLKDKNGRKIYEGDIVKVSGEVALNDDICVDPIAEIVWVDSAAGFGEKFTVKEAPMMPVGLYKYEVIGDIHENPELLGGEK